MIFNYQQNLLIRVSTEILLLLVLRLGRNDHINTWTLYNVTNDAVCSFIYHFIIIKYLLWVDITSSPVVNKINFCVRGLTLSGRNRQ